MSADKSKDVKTTENVDDELADLLDSALEDFKKDPTKNTKTDDTKDEEPAANVEEKEEEIANVANTEPNLEEWNEEFIREAAAQFEASLATFLNQTADGSNELTPEQIQEKFQQMAEAAKQVIENPTVTADTTDFASTISQTIQNLNTGAENLQNPLSEQDILNMFNNSNSDNDSTNAFLPFMQGMMQSLLSKDVLYPSLKDILEKFPDWLATNRNNLTNDDIVKYEKQIKLMDDVCKELETENETDGNDVKKQRFEKVLNLMQKLQDCGQPPAELVGDCGPPLPTELQNDPNQCCLM